MPKIGLALQTVSSIGLERTLKQQLRFLCACLCANVNSLKALSGALSRGSVGSGTLIKPDSKEGFEICQILPLFATRGQFLPPLSCGAQRSWPGQVEACGSLAFCCKHHFWGGVVVFCIFCPRCDRLKVSRAGPEITVTEITPAQEAKKGKANGTLCLHGDGERSC